MDNASVGKVSAGLCMQRMRQRAKFPRFGGAISGFLSEGGDALDPGA